MLQTSHRILSAVAVNHFTLVRMVRPLDRCESHYTCVDGQTLTTNLQAASSLRSVMAAHILSKQLCDCVFAALVAAVRTCSLHASNVVRPAGLHFQDSKMTGNLAETAVQTIWHCFEGRAPPQTRKSPIWRFAERVENS